MVEEIRYKRSEKVSDNQNKHELPKHLQAGGPGDRHVSNVYTNTSLVKQDREKRGLIGIALPILGKLATIALKPRDPICRRKEEGQWQRH